MSVTIFYFKISNNFKVALKIYQNGTKVKSGYKTLLVETFFFKINALEKILWEYDKTDHWYKVKFKVRFNRVESMKQYPKMSGTTT